MKQNIERNILLLEQHSKGLGARKLAKLFNITPQRVSKIIQSYASSDLTPKKNVLKSS